MHDLLEHANSEQKKLKSKRSDEIREWFKNDTQTDGCEAEGVSKRIKRRPGTQAHHQSYSLNEEELSK